VPTVLHFKIAKMALEAGIHVLIEKPITQSIEEAEELIHLAQSKGLILQVGHVERFNGAVQEISKIVNNPLFVEARRMSPFTPRVKDISVVLDLMIHDIDVVATLIKSPIIKINAMGNRIFSEFQFENGCIANLSASRATQNKIRTLSLTQEKSYIFLNYADQDIHIHRHASQAYLMTREEIRYSQESFIEQLYVHKDNPLKLEHIHFYETITQGATPIVSGEMDIKILKISHEIIDQIQKSNIERIQPIG
jgi:predicted dehydrogenase